jgi:dihydroxyacetone kinase
MLTDISGVDNAEAKKVLKAGLERVIAAEPDVTHYDTVVGKLRSCGIIAYHALRNILTIP